MSPTSPMPDSKTQRCSSKVLPKGNLTTLLMWHGKKI